MSFPSPVKTWQFTVNQTLVVSASATIHAQKSINKIVKMMQGVGTNPWVAITSSNCGIVSGVPNDAAHGGGGAVGSGDRWTIDGNVLTQAGGVITVDNDVNFAAAGTRHSWIVLRQTGLATNFEVCFDLSGSAGAGTITFSPSAGFTGGTATDRPTATDEVRILGGASAATFLPSENTQRVFHYTQSTDGQCSRLWVWQSGTTNRLFLMFDKAQHPISGWTNPVYVFVESTTTGNDGTIASSSTNFYANRRFRSRIDANTVALIGFTHDFWSSGSAVRSLPINTFSAEWPVCPIAIACSTNASSDGGGSGSASVVPPAIGRIGNVFDMWWRPASLATGDSFPNNAATRQYMSIGDIVVPWVGDGTALTIT